MSWYSVPGIFWFRIFGYGLHVKDTKKFPPIFSERFGLKGVLVGHYYVEVLTPWKT